MDNFEKYISILKFDQLKNDHKSLESVQECFDSNDSYERILEMMDASKARRGWIARRVDFIVCPISQFPFALIGKIPFLFLYTESYY